jgi:hypothetical protein
VRWIMPAHLAHARKGCDRYCTRRCECVREMERWIVFVTGIARAHRERPRRGEAQVSLAVVRDKRDKVIPADVRFAPLATEFLRRRRPPLRAKSGLSHTQQKKHGSWLNSPPRAGTGSNAEPCWATAQLVSRWVRARPRGAGGLLPMEYCGRMVL